MADVLDAQVDSLLKVSVRRINSVANPHRGSDSPVADDLVHDDTDSARSNVVDNLRAGQATIPEQEVQKQLTPVLPW